MNRHNRGNDIAISDQFKDRVIVIDKNGNLLAQYGNLNSSGDGTSNTQQGLFAPYDTKAIGEYKGLTKPLTVFPGQKGPASAGPFAHVWLTGNR